MQRFLSAVIAVAVCWLVFLSGFLCRNLLGDWLVAVHQGSLSFQVTAVATGLFRAFITFVLVCACAAAFVVVIVVLWAILQEVWYQFTRRRILSLMLRQSGNEEEPATSRPPKKSVRALNHAQRQQGPGVRGNKRPMRSVSERLRSLAEAAALEELDVNTDEMQVTVHDR